MKATRVAAVSMIAMCVGGCMVGPNYHTPATTMPDEFTAGLPTTRPATQLNAPPQPVDIARWWHSLGDSELDSLVDRAVNANLDLQIAVTRLQEVRTAQAATFGGSLPYLEADGAAGRGSGTNSTKGRVAGPLNAGTNTTGLHEITEVGGFDASWEIDLFGRLRRMMEAAKYDVQGSLEARNAVLITVVSDVARAYVDYRAIQVRQSILDRNIRFEQQTVDLVRARFDRGMTNELELSQAQRQLATLKSELAPLAASAKDAQSRIAGLLGLFPEDLAKELNEPMSMPTCPSEIQPGIPAELLRRRPDIRASERQLAGETARIGVATANLFPRVAITGGVGLQGQGLGVTPDIGKFIWSAGPQAYWPLLDFGTLDALLQIQNLRAHEALLNYRRTVLNALNETDSAILNFRAQQEHLRSLGEAVAAGQRTADLASQRYERGLTDFINVLDAERQLYDLQAQYAAVQETVILQFIAVYKSLGGGWEGFAPPPPPPSVRPAILAAAEYAAHPSKESPLDHP